MTLRTYSSPILSSHFDKDFQGWAPFSYKWLRHTNKKVAHVQVDRLGQEPKVLDLASLITDIGSELIPVVTPDYDDYDPIKGHMTVEKY